MGTFAFLLGVTSLSVAVLGFLGYFIQVLWQDHVARALRDTGVTQDAAPAPHPQVPERAPDVAASVVEECMVIGCVAPWTVVTHGWKVCARHDHRAPYDRTLDPDLVSEEAEQWLRRTAS